MFPRAIPCKWVHLLFKSALCGMKITQVPHELGERSDHQACVVCLGTGAADMVEARRLDCCLDPPRRHRRGHVHMLPLTPVAEQYSTTMLQRAKNASPMLPVDPAENSKVLTNLMTRAGHQSLGGLRQNMQGHIAESMDKGMKTFMHTAVHKEAKQVFM